MRDRGRADRPGPPGLPRLLTPRADALDEHLGRHGPLPALGLGVIDVVERAGLTGRGGAGFPTAAKLYAVATGRRGAVVVANGGEGEPASRKDRTLLTVAPHLVLDGIAVAAAAVGARRAVLCVHEGFADGRVRRALDERRLARLDRVPVELQAIPRWYVASEETALVSWLNGGPAVPLSTPPRPYERGVRGRPTLVQNVESLAHLALIARYGAGWFRSVGTPDAPGTRLFTIDGDVAAPGVYELPQGMSVRFALEAAGGRPDEVPAALVGGYFGGWLPATAFGAALSRDGLAAVGGAPGAGVLVALPRAACGLRETARVARYLAGQSAGQCGPCRFGLPAIADDVAILAAGDRPRELRAAEDRLRVRLRIVAGRGACRHPDGAIRFVESALRVFAEDIERHARAGPCPPTPPVRPVPVEEVAAR